MRQKQNRSFNLPLFIVVVIAAIFGWIIYTRGVDENQKNSQLFMAQHISEDLGISLEYPKKWYIEEKDLSILLASYATRVGENSQPNSEQIKIFIDGFSGCHPTIEENLKDPGCGEGGPEVKLNEIVSKESRETQGGTFYMYIVKSPNSQFTYYLLQSGERVLQISKQPDPSQFEKEFEEIVNSIRFL